MIRIGSRVAVRATWLEILRARGISAEFLSDRSGAGTVLDVVCDPRREESSVLVRFDNNVEEHLDPHQLEERPPIPSDMLAAASALVERNGLSLYDALSLATDDASEAPLKRTYGDVAAHAGDQNLDRWGRSHTSAEAARLLWKTSRAEAVLEARAR